MSYQSDVTRQHHASLSYIYGTGQKLLLLKWQYFLRQQKQSLQFTKFHGQYCSQLCSNSVSLCPLSILKSVWLED